jgi:hypothetical protein
MNIGDLVAAARGNENPKDSRGYFQVVGRIRVLYNDGKIPYADPSENIGYISTERLGFL